MANLAVTAKIKRTAECADDDCQECDGAKNCYKCSGALKPQAKECVTDCHLGYWEHKGNCKACSAGCKDCKSPTLCQECDASKVLYAGACQATCPVGYHVKNRVCIKTPIVKAGKFENKDLAVYRDNCKLVYDKPWKHSTTNDEIRTIKASCGPATLISFGGTNPDDEN